MPGNNAVTQGSINFGTSRVELGETLADADCNILIGIKSDDEAYKASDAAGVRVIGVNDGGEKDHDEGDYIVVSRKVVGLVNSSNNAVTAAHIGTLCYVEDEKTVRSSGQTHKVYAGTVVDVDTTNGIVYVAVGVNSALAIST